MVKQSVPVWVYGCNPWKFNFKIFRLVYHFDYFREVKLASFKDIARLVFNSNSYVLHIIRLFLYLKSKITGSFSKGYISPARLYLLPEFKIIFLTDFGT